MGMAAFWFLSISAIIPDIFRTLGLEGASCLNLER